MGHRAGGRTGSQLALGPQGTTLAALTGADVLDTPCGPLGGSSQASSRQAPTLHLETSLFHSDFRFVVKMSLPRTSAPVSSDQASGFVTMGISVTGPDPCTWPKAGQDPLGAYCPQE